MVWFQGDGGGVSDADRADAAGGAPGGGVLVDILFETRETTVEAEIS